MRFLLPRPKPSEAYLSQAGRTPERSSSPRPLLVVIDLNGTLIHRNVGGGQAFIARPRMREFLTYLLAEHKVIVWSSARPSNVRAISDRLFCDAATKPVRVWDRSHLRLTPEQYTQRVQVYKQLGWIWADPSIQRESAVHQQSTWSQANTVLVDDSEEKAASEPHNLVRIDNFEARPEQLGREGSDVLGQVVRYLRVASEHVDVSAFVKHHPFAFDPTAEAFDWDTVRRSRR